VTLLTNSDYVLHTDPDTSNPAAKPTALILSTQFELLALAMEFMRLVINGTSTSFTQPKTSWARKELTPLGNMLPYLKRFSELYSRGHNFHPFLSFFFEEYRKHPIKDCGDCFHSDVTAHGKKVSDIFDNFIATLRTTAMTVKLRKRAADWDGKFRKNLNRLRKQEAQMFRRHVRVLAVRLDLHHKATHFTEEDLFKHVESEARRHEADRAAYVSGAGLDFSEPVIGRVPFETVQRDRERLFANMKGKPSLFKHLVSYVWRIEFTPGAGYHLHVALFFNGSKVQNHEWLAQQIGEYWRDVITEGRGRFHNCNMAWNKDAPNYALGIINYTDHTKRAALLSALGYLCKLSQQVLVMPYEGCKLFGAGFVHRERKNGSGRPRSKDSARVSGLQGTAK
jgi:hypothetical protein